MRRLLLGLLASAALVVAACSPETTTQPAPTAPGETVIPTASPEVVDLVDRAYKPTVGATGGEIVVGDFQEANQFNPYYPRLVTEANVASAVWSSLVTLTGDARYAPNLAIDIPTTVNGGVKVPGDGSDAMTVTWKLKDGLKWSDGQPLTCDDFKYAWEWVLDKDNAGLTAGTAGWDKITAFDCPDATTLVLHFSEIYEGYITLLTAPLPRHYLSKIPIKDQVQGAGFRPDEVKNMPVSGAFKFDSVTPGAELRLVRNDNYKGFKSGKAANLDTLVFKWYPNAEAMIAGFAAGEVDVATELQDSDIPNVNAEGLHDQIVATPAFLYEFLRPNWADGSKEDPKTGVGGCSRNAVVADRGKGCPMSDPAMRQAVAYAIDKNEINNRVQGGNVQVANTNISPSAWFFADETPSNFDPAKANSILDAAGWVKGSDGIRSKNGLRAKIELCTTTRQFRIDTLGLIADWLKDVGIEAISNPVSAADMFATFDEGTIDTPCALSHSNFDLAEHTFNSSIDPLGNFFSYHSSQLEPNGVNNAQVVNPDIDKALDTISGSVDLVAIKHAMKSFQDVYVSQTVEIPLYYRKNVELVNSRLGNYFPNSTQAGPTWNVVDWFVKG